MESIADSAERALGSATPVEVEASFASDFGDGLQEPLAGSTGRLSFPLGHSEEHLTILLQLVWGWAYSQMAGREELT